MSVGVMKDYKLKQRNLRWVGQVVVTEGSHKNEKKKGRIPAQKFIWRPFRLNVEERCARCPRHPQRCGFRALLRCAGES
jgi:hypothetical protein